MPRKRAIEGAGDLRKKLSIIAENLGNNKSALARELGISYYRASKIIDAKKEGAPLVDWFGERGDVKAYGRVVSLERAVEESQYEEIEQRRRGKKEIGLIPKGPPRDAPEAQPFKVKTFKNGTRESYHVDNTKKINVPRSRGYVQIYAKGKGKSRGKNINKLFSSAHNSLSDAWASFNRYRNQTGFTASSIEVVVTKIK